MRYTFFLCLLVSCGGPARVQILSEPEGALVTWNGEERGRTPLTLKESFRGTVDLLLELESYEPYRSAINMRPEWYEVPPLDLLAEPKDRTFSFVLDLEDVDHKSLKERALEFQP